MGQGQTTLLGVMQPIIGAGIGATGAVSTGAVTNGVVKQMCGFAVNGAATQTSGYAVNGAATQANGAETATAVGSGAVTDGKQTGAEAFALTAAVSE